VHKLLALLSLGFGLFLPRTARAEVSRQTCLDSFEQAQRARKDGQFTDAKRKFRVCADAACPAMVRKDCTDALAGLGSKIPSIRVTVHAADGSEVESFDLLVDGESRPHGSEPVELDPGEHAVKVELDDGSEREQRVTLRPGDQSVPVVIDFRSAAGKTKAPSPSGRSTPIAAYAFGGVALVAAGSFVTFALVGRGVESCKGHCSEHEISSIHRDFLIADVSLAIALVSAGAAGYFFFSAPKGEAREHARPFVAARPIPGGSAFAAGVSF
jgi:hypothetical protein